MEVITIETPSLGDRSYVVHDGSVAMVVDPQRDIDRVLAAVEDTGTRVTHVVETHLHNDYVSGGLVLAQTTGAEYLLPDGAEVSFDCRPARGGDRFSVGSLDVEVVATPGHTDHHVSYVVRADGEPPAVFSGGSLLLGTVGRTDLVDQRSTESLTRAQHRSVRDLVDGLPDETQVLPTHGFGSFCASAGSGDDSDGSLGTERKVNLALTIDDEDDFVERLVSGLSAYPRYYAHMGPRNQAGGLPVDLSPPEPVAGAELARRIHRGEWVVDLRSRKAFASDHLSGTIGIELDDPFATYVGWLIPWGTPLTLLGDDPEQVAEAQRQLVRIGIDRPSGVGTGKSPEEWAPEHERSSYDAVDFAEAYGRRQEGTVLDVRRDDERDSAHIADSRHVPIDQLLERLDDVPGGLLLVHCASGFRASIASSLLDRAGRDVVLIDDDFDNAADAGFEIV